MFIRKIEKHHWLQWNSVHFQMNNECTFLLRDSNAFEMLTVYCCTSQNNFSWNLLAAVDMLLMNWLLSSCLLEPVLNLSFPMMHYCTKTFFIFLEIKSGFHGHPLFVQNFVISYNPVKFIQVQINICCRNDQCWNDVMKMIDDDFCGRYASKSAISLLAHVLKKCIAYNII